MAKKSDDPNDKRPFRLTAEEYERFTELSKAALRVETEAGNADEIEMSPEDVDVLRAMRELEGASEVSWQIYRVLPLEKAGWVGALPTALLQVAAIAKKWGPGKYRVRGVNPNGTWAKQRTVDIAEPAEGSTSAMNSAANAATGVQDLIEYMRAENDKRADAIKSWAMVLIPVLPQVIGLFKQERTGITELVAAMQGLKSVQQPDDPMAKMRDMLSMMSMLREASGAGEGGNTTGRTWIDGLVEAAKEVVPALLAGRAMAQPQPRPALPGVRPAFVPPAPVQPGAPVQPAAPGQSAAPDQPGAPAANDEGNPMLKLLNWFREQLAVLTNKAARNANPELWAEALADDLPAGISPEMLEQLLNRADWWSLLCQFHPPVAPFQAWFIQLRSELLGMIAEARETAAPSQGAAPGESIIEREQALAGETIQTE